jgi:hypothetical protein
MTRVILCFCTLSILTGLAPLHAQMPYIATSEAQRKLHEEADQARQKNDEKLAVELFEKAARKEIDDIYANEMLAWIFATSGKAELRDGQKAVKHARKAADIAQKGVARGSMRTYYSVKYDFLAAAYAEAGDFKKAVEYQTKYMAAGNQSDFATKCLELYKANKPFHNEAK